MSYKKLSKEKREQIIKKHEENTLIDKIERNIKKFSDNDMYLAITLAYEACKEDTPVSEYNNILLCELERIFNSKVNDNRFQQCVELWDKLTQKEKEIWRKRAKGQKVTGFNLFVSVCQVTKNEKKE